MVVSRKCGHLFLAHQVFDREQAIGHQEVAIDQRQVGSGFVDVEFDEALAGKFAARQFQRRARPVHAHVADVGKAEFPDAGEQLAGAAAEVAKHDRAARMVGQQIEHHVITRAAILRVGPERALRRVAMSRERGVVVGQDRVLGTSHVGGTLRIVGQAAL